MPEVEGLVHKIARKALGFKEIVRTGMRKDPSVAATKSEVPDLKKEAVTESEGFKIDDQVSRKLESFDDLSKTSEVIVRFLALAVEKYNQTAPEDKKLEKLTPLAALHDKTFFRKIDLLLEVAVYSQMDLNENLNVDNPQTVASIDEKFAEQLQTLVLTDLDIEKAIQAQESINQRWQQECQEWKDKESDRFIALPSEVTGLMKQMGCFTADEMTQIHHKVLQPALTVFSHIPRDGQSYSFVSPLSGVKIEAIRHERDIHGERVAGSIRVELTLPDSKTTTSVLQVWEGLKTEFNRFASKSQPAKMLFYDSKSGDWFSKESILERREARKNKHIQPETQPSSEVVPQVAEAAAEAILTEAESGVSSDAEELNVNQPQAEVWQEVKVDAKPELQKSISIQGLKESLEQAGQRVEYVTTGRISDPLDAFVAVVRQEAIALGMMDKKLPTVIREAYQKLVDSGDALVVGLTAKNQFIDADFEITSKPGEIPPFYDTLVTIFDNLSQVLSLPDTQVDVFDFVYVLNQLKNTVLPDLKHTLEVQEIQAQPRLEAEIAPQLTEIPVQAPIPINAPTIEVAPIKAEEKKPLEEIFSKLETKYLTIAGLPLSADSLARSRDEYSKLKNGEIPNSSVINANFEQSKSYLNSMLRTSLVNYLSLTNGLSWAIEDFKSAKFGDEDLDYVCGQVQKALTGIQTVSVADATLENEKLSGVALSWKNLDADFLLAKRALAITEVVQFLVKQGLADSTVLNDSLKVANELLIRVEEKAEKMVAVSSTLQTHLGVPFMRPLIDSREGILQSNMVPIPKDEKSIEALLDQQSRLLNLELGFLKPSQKPTNGITFDADWNSQEKSGVTGQTHKVSALDRKWILKEFHDSSSTSHSTAEQNVWFEAGVIQKIRQLLQEKGLPELAEMLPTTVFVPVAEAGLELQGLTLNKPFLLQEMIQFGEAFENWTPAEKAKFLQAFTKLTFVVGNELHLIVDDRKLKDVTNAGGTYRIIDWGEGRYVADAAVHTQLNNKILSDMRKFLDNPMKGESWVEVAKNNPELQNMLKIGLISRLAVEADPEPSLARFDTTTAGQLRTALELNKKGDEKYLDLLESVPYNDVMITILSS